MSQDKHTKTKMSKKQVNQHCKLAKLLSVKQISSMTNANKNNYVTLNTKRNMSNTCDIIHNNLRKKKLVNLTIRPLNVNILALM